MKNDAKLLDRLNGQENSLLNNGTVNYSIRRDDSCLAYFESGLPFLKYDLTSNFYNHKIGPPI
jgi:hypothetical protein